MVTGVKVRGTFAAPQCVREASLFAREAATVLLDEHGHARRLALVGERLNPGHLTGRAWGPLSPPMMVQWIPSRLVPVGFDVHGCLGLWKEIDSRAQVHCFQERFHAQEPDPRRDGQQHRNPLIGGGLVLDADAEPDVGVAVAPVAGKVVPGQLGSLGQDLVIRFGVSWMTCHASSRQGSASAIKKSLHEQVKPRSMRPASRRLPVPLDGIAPGFRADDGVRIAVGCAPSPRTYNSVYIPG